MDDFDIYDDLNAIDQKQKIEELEKLNSTLTEKIENLKIDVKIISSEREKFKNDNEILLTNLSSLYKTAVAEVKRKDRMITDLRSELNSITFRRKPPYFSRTPINEKSTNSEVTKDTVRKSSLCSNFNKVVPNISKEVKAQPILDHVNTIPPIIEIEDNKNINQSSDTVSNGENNNNNVDNFLKKTDLTNIDTSDFSKILELIKFKTNKKVNTGNNKISQGANNQPLTLYSKRLLEKQNKINNTEVREKIEESGVFSNNIENYENKTDDALIKTELRKKLNELTELPSNVTKNNSAVTEVISEQNIELNCNKIDTKLENSTKHDVATNEIEKDSKGLKSLIDNSNIENKKISPIKKLKRKKSIFHPISIDMSFLIGKVVQSNLKKDLNSKVTNTQIKNYSGVPIKTPKKLSVQMDKSKTLAKSKKNDVFVSLFGSSLMSVDDESEEIIDVINDADNLKTTQLKNEKNSSDTNGLFSSIFASTLPKIVSSNPVVARYEDSTLGNFEDTVQFVGALKRPNPLLSPIKTPEKIEETNSKENKLNEEELKELKNENKVWENAIKNKNEIVKNLLENETEVNKETIKNHNANDKDIDINEEKLKMKECVKLDSNTSSISTIIESNVENTSGTPHKKTTFIHKPRRIPRKMMVNNELIAKSNTSDTPLKTDVRNETTNKVMEETQSSPITINKKQENVLLQNSNLGKNGKGSILEADIGRLSAKYCPNLKRNSLSHCSSSDEINESKLINKSESQVTTRKDMKTKLYKELCKKIVKEENEMKNDKVNSVNRTFIKRKPVKNSENKKKELEDKKKNSNITKSKEVENKCGCTIEAKTNEQSICQNDKQQNRSRSRSLEQSKNSRRNKSNSKHSKSRSSSKCDSAKSNYDNNNRHSSPSDRYSSDCKNQSSSRDWRNGHEQRLSREYNENQIFKFKKKKLSTQRHYQKSMERKDRYDVNRRHLRRLQSVEKYSVKRQRDYRNKIDENISKGIEEKRLKNHKTQKMREPESQIPWRLIPIPQDILNIKSSIAEKFGIKQSLKRKPCNTSEPKSSTPCKIIVIRRARRPVQFVASDDVN